MRFRRAGQDKRPEVFSTVFPLRLQHPPLGSITAAHLLAGLIARRSIGGRQANPLEAFFFGMALQIEFQSVVTEVERA